MRKKVWMMILAAALMLSACSGAKTPETVRPSGSGETLPQKPSAQESTEATRGLPDDTLPEQTEQQTTAAPETEEPVTQETTAPSEDPSEEPFVTPDFYTGKTYEVDHSYYAFEEEGPYILDGEGHLLDAKKLPRRIEDVLTGETAFYTKVEYEKTGKNYEDFRVLSTLYDRDGNVLQDRAEYLYSYACGDCLVRVDSYNATLNDWEMEDRSDWNYCLYNPYTGEVRQKDVAYLTKLNQGSALAMDYRSNILGVVDAAGFALHGFPMDIGPLKYPVVYGDRYILAESEDGADGGTARVLFDADFNYIDYASEEDSYTVFDLGEKGIFLSKDVQDMDNYIFDVDKWEIVATFDRHVSDMSEDRILCAPDDEEAFLLDWEGNVIAGPYEEIKVFHHGVEGPWESYVARNGEELFLLDNDGMVLETRSVKDLNYYGAYGQIVYCGISEYDPFNDYYGYGMLVLNDRLEQIIPDGYENYANMGPGVYVCPKPGEQNTPKLDIFNEKGELFFEDALSVGQGDEQYIPVVKGFYVGLIDHQGNWVAKNYKYTEDMPD